MIKSLRIRNYALFKDVSIDFKQGFTVISGETGAGKSIMLEALSLLFGKRVERLSTSESTPKSIIEGVFVIDDSKKNFFSDNDLDFEEETVIRREISQKNKSRAFINDTPVLLHTLSLFGKQIIEIYSQHQSILLKDDNAQFKLIDDLSKSEVELHNYQQELKKYSCLKTDLDTIKSSSSISISELEFLQYQLTELQEANLIINEKQDLEQKISLLENIDGIASVILDGEYLLNHEQGILASLSSIKRRLLEFDSFSELQQRVDSVLIELNDINTELSNINNKLDSDPDQLLKLNNRLDLLNNLLQKHRKQFIEELIDLKIKIEDKISCSSSFEIRLIAKQEELDAQLKVLSRSAKLLNVKRDKAVPLVKQQIQAHLKQLGMPYAKFGVSFTEIDTFRKNGNTDITFLFSANKGNDLQEVSKVASGGELSRLMLAIKYIVTQSSKVNTIVFDEIDSGVSGEIASLMGDMMLDISKTNQLVAISHLPQIASKADIHLKVVKNVTDSNSVSNVLVLNKDERIEEIAKLLSGKKLTKAAFDNAAELLNQ
tara:strand:+ start:958 stop:2595 length:1638 start_codon:yes stop_codon:yes gene_type:complete